jgi:hypothetical protein
MWHNRSVVVQQSTVNLNLLKVSMLFRFTKASAFSLCPAFCCAGMSWYGVVCVRERERERQRQRVSHAFHEFHC